MTVKEYTAVCLNFAKETAEHSELSSTAFYTTRGSSWWETCDNSNGGIDVSWAFHQSEEYIKENAAQFFVDEIASLVNLAIDDEWDSEQLEYIAEMVNR